MAQIREMAAARMSSKQIAANLGVSDGSVRTAATNVYPPIRFLNRGLIFTDDLLARAHAMRASGVPLSEIARTLGVRPRSLSTRLSAWGRAHGIRIKPTISVFTPELLARADTLQRSGHTVAGTAEILSVNPNSLATAMWLWRKRRERTL
jgi:DNA-binding CsgD family transcriptional regulator